jgi:tetratricopeptide (TPR) repeat protein
MVESITSVADVANPIYALAIRFYEAKNYPKALRLMEYLIRSQAPQVRYFRTAAVILQADSQFEKAIGFYKRADQSGDSQDPLVSLGHGQCLVMLKQYAQALPFLKQAQESLKGPGVNPKLRDQLVKICLPLLERVQEICSQD